MIGTADSKPNETDLFGPSQCLVISNEPGGGEQDTSMDWQRNHVRVSPASSSESIVKAQLSNSFPRANSPTIQAFIEQEVEVANHEIPNIDCVVEFCEEGSGSGATSLSSICSSLEEEEEEYTMDRLREAGPKFLPLTDLLEAILEEDYVDSASEVTHTTQ